MAIVDYAYYSTVYMGREASECDFPALETRAEDVIGIMTRWRVTADTIAAFSPFVRTLVKKAICAQVDFFAVNGTESATGESGNGRGWSVGKVSVSGKSGSELTRNGALSGAISPMALAYLEQTGLMNPQVETAPDMPLIGWW